VRNKLTGRSVPLLVEYLVCKENKALLTEQEWELFLLQARAAGLIARLSIFARKKRYFSVPLYISNHFDAADVYFATQKRIVQWEIKLLAEAFSHLQLPLILLKGAAYAASGTGASDGRVFNDIDILVSQNCLEKVKSTLVWYGWVPEKLDAYDQQYYNRWMHELPPMHHIKRQTTLDIHHNILPRTSKLFSDSEKLIADIVRIPGTDFWTLKPEDMVLHSACHLFLGGEFENGLRDLSDMDLLLRQFSEERLDFFQKLVERGLELGFQQPLFYSLRYTKILLECPIPDNIFHELEQNKVNKLWMMDFLFLRALKPDHPSCNDRWTGFARWILYIRSHWLKMPLYLLIPHLLRKSWIRLMGKESL